MPRAYKKVDKSSPDFLAALATAQAPLPPVPSWSYAEVQLFDNGAERRGRQTEHTLKISASDATDFRKLRRGLRRSYCVHRWASLSGVDVFSRNCTPSRKSGVPLSEAERALARAFMAAARQYNREREADDQPAALLGWLVCRLLGAGTSRCGAVVLVTWAPLDGEWLPCVTMMHTAGDAGDWVLRSRANANGRGDRACRWLHLHYSADYRAHLVSQREAAEAASLKRAA